MGILDKAKYAKKLHEYYLEHYGERKTDVWYEPPAVNVLVFGRDGRFITLKSHILTGNVTAYVE